MYGCTSVFEFALIVMLLQTCTAHTRIVQTEVVSSSDCGLACVINQPVHFVRNRCKITDIRSG